MQDIPSEKELVRLTLRRAKDVARSAGITVGALTKKIVNDRRVLDDLAAGKRSITLSMYQRLHDGFSAEERSAA
jgi:hypothetical protein